MNLPVGEQRAGFGLSHAVSVTWILKGWRERIHRRVACLKRFCLTENAKSNG